MCSYTALFMLLMLLVFGGAHCAKRSSKTKSDRSTFFNAWHRSPHVWAHIQDVFGKGKVVHIDDALKPAKARALFKEFEDPSFTYAYMAATYPMYQFSGTTNMPDMSGGRTPTWRRLHRYLESKAVLANMSRAAGVALTGLSDKVSVNPPGNFTGPHTDVSARGGERRRITWVLHMCKDWDDNLGGDLIMLTIPNAPSGYHVIPCRFNSLTMFPVHRLHSTHMVMPVHIGGPGESWNPSRDRRVRGPGNKRLPAGVAPRRLAHQGWPVGFMQGHFFRSNAPHFTATGIDAHSCGVVLLYDRFVVEDNVRTWDMDEGELPAGANNAAGDDWLAVYVDGFGRNGMRHCRASLAVYCMFGINARRGWDATGLDTPTDRVNYWPVQADDFGVGGAGGGITTGGRKEEEASEAGDCDAEFL